MVHIQTNDFQTRLSADPLVNMFKEAVAAVNKADDEDNETAGEACEAIIYQIGRAASTQDPVDIRGVIVRLGYVLGSIDQLAEGAGNYDDATIIAEEMISHLKRCVQFLARTGAVDIHGEGLGFHHV